MKRLGGGRERRRRVIEREKRPKKGDWGRGEEERDEEREVGRKGGWRGRRGLPR
jgi:hypothetical protein